MKKNIKKIVFALLSVVSIFTYLSCSDNEDVKFSSDNNYYKNTQLINIYDNEVDVLNNKLTTQIDELISLVEILKNSPTSSNLLNAQNKWIGIVQNFKIIELYDLGDITKSLVLQELNYWPTDVQKIEENINDEVSIGLSYLSSKGADVKGISAIEYLLFSNEGNEAVLESFTTNENASKRLDYLFAACANVKERFSFFISIWEEYEQSFKTSLDSGLGGSQNEVVNAIVVLIEEIIINKIGKPLEGTDLVEAPYSNYSKEIIAQNLLAIDRCFSGDFANTPLRFGFDNFLELVGNEVLITEINTSILDCQEKLEAIKGSLANEISTNPQGVEELRLSFVELLNLVKLDLASALGATITFSANDGD